MFRIELTPESVMRENHARARAAAPRPQAQSQVVGALEVARLLDKREFVYRGRPYQVPPVPWPLAAEMEDVRKRLRALGEDSSLEQKLSVFEDAARLSKSACRPAGRIRRLFWPLTPNPFRKATPWQVARNLGFFSMCLILDGDLPRAMGQDPAPGTSRPTSPRSSPASPLGRTRKAGRSRGATS